MKSICTLIACMVLSTAALAQQNQAVQVSNLKTITGPTPDTNYIVGTATNTTNERLDTVSVTFNLYDDQNALVGNAVDTGLNLEPNGIWKFKAIAKKPYDHADLSRVLAH
ncbi:FxLYD domain-containing protein [Caballeronia glebae]|uniref:Uncharacterized protein n=1 Tax=Caballeronia glebae TaxID=1777143 RepID=A0A158B6U5_9BURK|nr:FxLYD domain-containing protein [Caballeronia glebae]SAK65077.1 hypothetical protein AWB82_03522 [Caballeronia glebae]